jgi:mRNA interferase MazF
MLTRQYRPACCTIRSRGASSPAWCRYRAGGRWLDSKANRVLCAPINTSGVGLSTEVQVGVDEGLKHDSVINCDQITRLEKSMLTDYIGTLSLPKLKQLRTALVVAFDIDDDLDADILDLT